MTKPKVNIDLECASEIIFSSAALDFKIVATAFRDGNDIISVTRFGKSGDKITAHKIRPNG